MTNEECQTLNPGDRVTVTSPVPRFKPLPNPLTVKSIKRLGVFVEVPTGADYPREEFFPSSEIEKAP